MTQKANQYSRHPDTDIINRILNGDAALYEVLIRRYNPLLYKIGRTYNYNHQDTQDLIQESYISAWCGLAHFENRASFRTWLTRIMLNHCYKRKQKFSYKKEITEATHQIANTPPMFHHQVNSEKILLNKELAGVLETALKHIPEDYRIVFTLRELNGFDVAETAETLDITESNVKVRLSRAKVMLRNEVGKLYSPAELFEFNEIYCNAIVEKVMSRIFSMAL